MNSTPNAGEQSAHRPAPAVPSDVQPFQSPQSVPTVQVNATPRTYTIVNHDDEGSHKSKKIPGGIRNDPLGTISFCMTLALTVHTLLYVIYDIISISLTGQRIAALGNFQPYVAHISVTAIHLAMTVPTIVVEVFGIVSSVPTDKVSSQVKKVMGILYCIGLFLIVVCKVVLNIADLSTFNGGIGEGFGFSVEFLICTFLGCLTICRIIKLQ
jgi:hypothetical protein